MKLFPIKYYEVELREDNSVAMEKLRQNTDLTDLLVSDWTKKEFRGQVKENGFNIISSEIGRGAFCVLTGEFEGTRGWIEIRIHKVFTVLLSILLLIPFIGFIISFLSSRIEYSIGIVILMISFVLFVRFVFIELSFRFISREGFKKLIKTIGITDLEKVNNRVVCVQKRRQ